MEKKIKNYYGKLIWASLLLEYPTTLEYLRRPETTFMSSGSTKPTLCIYKSESDDTLSCMKNNHQKMININCFSFHTNSHATQFQ